MQSNYFSRPKVAGANSGSGNEVLHDLGFDASKQFAAYSFRWSHGKIEWFVNGKSIRTEHWKADKPTPLQSYSTMRVVFNKWVCFFGRRFDCVSFLFVCWCRVRDLDCGRLLTGCFLCLYLRARCSLAFLPAFAFASPAAR